MKNRVKILILLSVTLIIGLVIGFLVNGRITSYRIDKMRHNYSNTGFGREIVRIIKPNAEQSKELKPILSAFAQKNKELLDDYHQEKEELFVDLKEELADILDDDQLKRLEEFNSDKNKRFKRTPTHRKGKPRHKPGGHVRK